jgi:hypothetical protein
MRPAVEKALDVRRPERIAGGLQSGRIGTREKAIVEALKPDAIAAEPLFDPFMAVETELDWIREVGADLEERRTPLAVVKVEIEMVDSNGLSREVEGEALPGPQRL